MWLCCCWTYVIDRVDFCVCNCYFSQLLCACLSVDLLPARCLSPVEMRVFSTILSSVALAPVHTHRRALLEPAPESNQEEEEQHRQNLERNPTESCLASQPLPLPRFPTRITHLHFRNTEAPKITPVSYFGMRRIHFPTQIKPQEYLSGSTKTSSSCA